MTQIFIYSYPMRYCLSVSSVSSVDENVFLKVSLINDMVLNKVLSKKFLQLIDFPIFCLPLQAE